MRRSPSFSRSPSWLRRSPRRRSTRRSPASAIYPSVPRLGLTVAPAGQVAGSGSEGVVVTEVDPNGIASDQGVKTGDVILEVGGKKIASPSDVRTALTEAQSWKKSFCLLDVHLPQLDRSPALDRLAARLAKRL